MRYWSNGFRRLFRVVSCMSQICNVRYPWNDFISHYHLLMCTIKLTCHTSIILHTCITHCRKTHKGLCCEIVLTTSERSRVSTPHSLLAYVLHISMMRTTDGARSNTLDSLSTLDIHTAQFSVARRRIYVLYHQYRSTFSPGRPRKELR